MTEEMLLPPYPHQPLPQHPYQPCRYEYLLLPLSLEEEAGTIPPQLPSPPQRRLSRHLLRDLVEVGLRTHLRRNRGSSPPTTTTG